MNCQVEDADNQFRRSVSIKMKNGLVSPAESNSRTVSRLYKIIGFLMVLSAICKLPLHYIFNGWNLQGYGYTEFLINFEGGFVRRGLLGEVLLWITAHTGIHPHIPIVTLCLLAFAFVLCFFLYAFKKKGYCWWIIFSPLLCGLVDFFIRKDYILYAIVICMFLLVRHNNAPMWKRFSAFSLGILGLMLHEAFFFWGIPLFALILLNDSRHRMISGLMLAAFFSVFGVLCAFKGDAATAQSIIDSWNSLLPGSPIEFVHRSSIGALTWDTKGAMIFHFMLNIGKDQLGLGIIYWPLIYFAVYYFITFFFCVFKPKRASFGRDEQTVLSAMFLILTFCLLPMFTILSCDYGRLFQYAALTSFAAFIIFDKSVMQRIIPTVVQSKIAKLNDCMARLIPPGKGSLVLLLFTIGISPAFFNMNDSLLQSPIGALWSGFWIAMYNVKCLYTALI